MHKPNLNSVRGDYHLPEQVKGCFGLTGLLKISANGWVDAQKLIDSYFVNCLVWEETGESYLKKLSDGLNRFSKSDAESSKIREYAKEVAHYLKSEEVVRKCSVYYKLKSAQADSKRQEVLARIQGDATGAILSNAGALNLRKRAFDEVFLEDSVGEAQTASSSDNQQNQENSINEEMEQKSSFHVSKNSVEYEIHTPTRKHFISPKKPVMQGEDRILVSEYFDIRLSSDVSSSCSSELETEYQTHVKDMQSNSCLKKILGVSCLDFMKSLFTIDLSNFSKQIFNLDCPADDVYVDFMKQSYNDLCMCFNSPQDYSIGGERTMFSEVFVQQFKMFAKMTRLLVFKWIEKKLPNADHSWLVKKDFVRKEVQLKLLDGIGIMKKNNVNFIMIESSGVEEDVLKHTLEDTLKNLKHGTDSLAGILCEFKLCSFETAKKIVVLTGHVIANKLTIIKYSCGSSCKWNAVETRSCAVPLTYEARKESIKLFEVFAYIYLTLKEQETVYDALADEKLGLVHVDEKDMVQNSASFL